MPSLLSRYATPLTTGLFLVSLISGVALFFHFGNAAFHGMHEWLSMVLILPFVLHIWRNWRSFLTYFKRLPMLLALGGSTIAAVIFAWPALTDTGGTGRGGPPQRVVFQALERGTVSTLAPVFGHDATSLTAALKEKGLTISGPDDSVRTIASASGKSSLDVIGAIAAAHR